MKKLPFDIRVLKKRAENATKTGGRIEALPEQGMRGIDFYISNDNRRAFLFDDARDEITSYNGTFDDPDFEDQDVKDAIYVAAICPRTIRKLLEVVKLHTNKYDKLETYCNRLEGPDVGDFNVLYSHLSINYYDLRDKKVDIFSNTFTLTKDIGLKNPEYGKPYGELEDFDNEFLGEENQIDLDLNTLEKYEYIVYANPQRMLELIKLYEELMLVIENGESQILRNEILK